VAVDDAAPVNLAAAGQQPPTPTVMTALLWILVSQEKTRTGLAYFLVALLALLVLAAVVVMFVTDIDNARVKDIFGLTFGPIVGLVGTVIGFYFGAESAKEAPKA
jgi:hypothetical protein